MDIKLNKLFFIFSLFSIHLVPFANSFSFETFPLLLILFSLYIFLFKNFSFKIFLNNNKIILLLLTYLCLFQLSNLLQNNIELIKYLIGPSIFLFFFYFKKYFGFNEILLFGIGMILLYFIFIFKIPILFNLSCNTLEFFIARLHCENPIKLNRPFLITPEPSYLALMLCFYLIIFNHFKEKVMSMNKKKLTLFIEIFICFIIYTTHSRIGAIFLYIYVFYFIYNYKLYKNLSLIFSLFILSSYILFFSNLSFSDTSKSKYNERIVDSRNILNIDFITERYKDNLSPLSKVHCRRIENKILTDANYNDTCNIENDLLTVINISEPTGFIRIFHNYLSFKAALDNNFLGYGLGSYAVLWYQHAKRFDVTHLVKLNEVMYQWLPYIEEKKQYVQNYFFSILHDGGFIPGIIILILLGKSLFNIIQYNYIFGYIIFFYTFITFFFQSTISSPYPWLSLALILFYKKKHA